MTILKTFKSNFLTTAWQQVLALTTLSVVYIFGAGWLGANVLPTVIKWGPGVPKNLDLAPNELPSLFARWDSGYYLIIATTGYEPNGTERAFFPLYPLIVRMLSAASQIPTLWCGLFVSVAALVGTSIIGYRWVRNEYGHSEGLFTIALLCFFPMTFFLVAFYSESLFLFLSILSLYYARQCKSVFSGLAIALAGACRPQAFLLGIPYLIEFWYHRGSFRDNWLPFSIGLGLAPVGLLTYTIFLGVQQPTFSLSPYFDLLNKEWLTHIDWPWVTWIDGINAALFGTNIGSDWFSRAYSTHDLLYAVLSALIGIYALRHMRLSIAAYLFVSILYFYSVRGPYGYAFDSMPRHVASLMPLYPAMALLTGRLLGKHRWIVLALCILMLGGLAAWFASGRWVS